MIVLALEDHRAPIMLLKYSRSTGDPTDVLYIKMSSDLLATLYHQDSGLSDPVCSCKDDNV